MTTTIATPIETAPRFADTVASEWSKMRALRLYPILIAAIVLLSVAVGVFMTIVGGGSVAESQAESQYSVIFYSSTLTTWAFAGLAANFVGIEFSGLGQATFTATTCRHRVLLAKFILIGAGGLLTGVVSSIATAATTQGMLALQGYQPLDLTDPGLIRAVLALVSTSMVVQGLVAASLAVLTRSAGWGLVAAMLISLLPVSFADLLGEWYAEHIPRWLPGASTESLAGVASPEGYGYLPPPLASVAIVAWVSALGVTAVLRLRRADVG